MQGVVHMHAANMAHLDLKPDNICMEMKDGQTHTCVVDYGSCLQQDTGEFFCNALVVSLLLLCVLVLLCVCC